MFWIFNSLFIWVFRAQVSGIFPGDPFPALLVEAPVYKGFMQFMALLEPRFSVGFSEHFSERSPLAEFVSQITCPGEFNWGLQVLVI